MLDDSSRLRETLASPPNPGRTRMKITDCGTNTIRAERFVPRDETTLG